MEITNAAVFKECQLRNRRDLFHAYCFSGCDDIVTSVRGFGFQRILKLIIQDQQLEILKCAIGTTSFTSIKNEILELEANIKATS